MSSQPNSPAPSTTTDKILNVLNSIPQYGPLVTIAVGGIVAAVKGIKGSIAGGQTVDFTVELTQEQADLLNAIATDEGDGAAINAELVRQGQPPIDFGTPPAA